MCRRVKEVCRQCKPVGIACGCVASIGLSVSVLAAVGLFTTTEPGAIADYNAIVWKWRHIGMRWFDNSEFQCCVVNGAGTTEFCANTYRVTDSTEGNPPNDQLAGYTAMHFDTNYQVLGPDRPFDISTAFRLRLFSGPKGEQLYPALGNDAATGQSWLTTQPQRVPAYTYLWDNKHATAAACEAALGMWLADESQCVLIFILDHICITVNRTSTGQWAVAGLYGDGVAATGCAPTQKRFRSAANFGTLGDWSMGTYTQVNGSAIGAMAHVPPAAGTPGAGPLRGPGTFPKSAWKGRFASVQVRLRSVYDPRLFAEQVTNGTLNFDRVGQGSYFFSGALNGFLGWALLWTGLLCFVVPLLTLSLAWCFCPSQFPRFAYGQVPREVWPGRRLKDHTRVYDRYRTDMHVPTF